MAPNNNAVSPSVQLPVLAVVGDNDDLPLELCQGKQEVFGLTVDMCSRACPFQLAYLLSIVLYNLGDCDAGKSSSY